MNKKNAGLKPAVFSKNNLQYEGTREDVVKAIKAVKKVKARRKINHPFLQAQYPFL